MNEQIQKLLIDLDEQLRFLNLEMDDPIKAAETAISIILKSVEKLKAYT